jgi:hypothetical protein
VNIDNHTHPQTQMVREFAFLLTQRWGVSLDDLCESGTQLLKRGKHSERVQYRAALIVCLRSIKMAGKPRWSFETIQRALFGVGCHSTAVTADVRHRKQNPPCVIAALESEAQEVWKQYRAGGHQQHKQAG